jgi:rRNA maturation protein Nop10
MILLRLIKEGEARLAVVSLVLLLFLAVIVSLILGIERLPSQRARISGSQLDLRGPAAGVRGWPSSTPHTKAWPSPQYWVRTTRRGNWYYHVRAPNQTDKDANGFSMQLMQSGWPMPVIERKEMWWDWDDPALKGPVPDPSIQILYGRLTLNTLLFGGGLWLIIFGPLGLFVVGRRVVWTLQGHCTFCGYDMTGFEQCPECGWRAKGSTPASSEVSSG